MTRKNTLAVALAAILASASAAPAQPPTPAEPSRARPARPSLPPPPPPAAPSAGAQAAGELVAPVPPLSPPAPATPSAEASVDLSVEVTISRFQGDELVSSLPYVLALTSEPSGSGSLRMGAEVPVLTMASANGGVVPQSFSYRPVGTEIDAFARGLDDDRYQVTVIIAESSVYGDDAAAMEAFRAPDVPVFRSFESRNTLVLRDGQSRQFTAATDRVTSESIRVDVALTVLDQEPAP